MRLWWMLVALFLGMLAAGVALSAASAESIALPAPVVSVFLQADDLPGLEQSLEQLQSLQRQGTAQIGTVYIIGDLGQFMSGAALSGEAVSNVQTMIRKLGAEPISTAELNATAAGPRGSAAGFDQTSAYKTLQRLGIENSRLLSAGQLLADYKVTSTPTWVVAHLGAETVYEGYTNPRDFVQTEASQTPSISEGAERKHFKRTSGTPLAPKPAGHVATFNETILAFDIAGSKRESARNKAVISYAKLPACSEAKTDLVPVFHNTDGSNRFDFVYYDPYDAAQREQAKRYPGYSIPYSPVLLRDPRSGLPNPLQGFARMVEVQCLPTHFRFIEVGGARYAQYAQGADAWKNSSNSSQESRRSAKELQF